MFIHCRGGISRSGTVVCQSLKQMGYTPKQALLMNIGVMERLRINYKKILYLILASSVTMNSKRADYWNAAYSEYWRKRVEETKTDQLESSVQAGDKVTEVTRYTSAYLKHLQPGNILDVVAVGAVFPFLQNRVCAFLE